MNINLEGKRAFVTGGDGGIGSVICERLKACGAEVIAPGMDEMDLSSEASIQAYLKSHTEMPDILIHCAGINKLAGVEETFPEDTEEVFQVNLFSFVSLLKHFTPYMKERQFGRIIGISSLYGIVSKERRIPYSASKHAMNGVIKSVALELAKDNVLINGVAPGYVMTDMTRKNLSSAEIEEIREMIPAGRMQEAVEIADLCCFLCSEYNRSITGQTIPVDGGYVCK